ncbi:MAG: formylglycine-generating enzyme family protein [Microcystis aeruginosa]
MEANQDPLVRLRLASLAAQRNQDREGEDLVRNAIAALASRGSFRTVQSLAQGSKEQSEFEVITVNSRGKKIKLELKQAQYFTENLSSEVILDMAAIPGGTFTMGSTANEKDSYDDERPQHQVTVPPFFLGKYPITQAQWKAIASRTDLKVEKDLDLNPAHFKDRPDSDRRPVEQVNWYEAIEFCARLSKLTGREYRLPSEAEWEYACRAGTTTPFYFGETITGELANYNASNTYADEPNGEYRSETTPVGQFPPNAFGLYDMHGNVREWCADTWHDNYDGAPTDGSVWIENGNNNRSPLRGGSWGYNPTYCRSAIRYDYYFRRVNRINNYGFRVVCGAGRTL